MDDGAAIVGVARVAREQRLRKSGNVRHHKWCCAFVFRISEQEARDFQLVPHLIGRGGCRLRSIAKACKGKIRIRGRGSGHVEGPKGEEANIPLQVVLSCASAEDYLLGCHLLGEVLDRMEVRFAQHCQAMQVNSPEHLYVTREDSRAAHQAEYIA